MARRHPVDPDMQRGFSLLELLVALVIFSVGMLAVAGLQTVSKQGNYESMQRTTAAQIANGLLEDMRMNGDAVDVYLAAGEMGGGSRGNEPDSEAAPMHASELLQVYDRAFELRSRAGRTPSPLDPIRQGMHADHRLQGAC